MKNALPVFPVLAAGLLLSQVAVPGHTAGPTFSAEQAQQGRALYQRHCGSCHGARLQGEHVTPALAGDRFDRFWRGKPLGALTFHFERMPPAPQGDPGGLSDDVYTKILAFILSSNGFEPGEQAMPSVLADIADLKVPELEGQTFDPSEPIPDGLTSERLTGLTPVTAEELAEPRPADWLLNGRTYDAHSFSPLSQITKDNIEFVTTAWRAPLQAGLGMPMPLVRQGVMFLHTFPDTVLALDATNGDVLWRYRHELERPSSQKMGLALAGDLLIVPTSDLHVLALKAKTGELVWDHAIRVETPAMHQAYQLRSAPLVAGNRVIQGITASFVPKGGFAVALDLETGKEAWRFRSIPGPDEPHGHTWNDVPHEKRSGGSVWHQGTYDPETDRLYFGVAPTYDTGPLLHAVDKEGITNDALYTNCTVALEASTGKMLWHYQHMANDQWDLDWVFERQLITVPINDKPRKVVLNTGKMAIVEALDAETGRYLFSVDPGIQNVITSIDPETGAKTIDESKLPDPARSTVVCPSAGGSRSWPPTAYSPMTQHLYLPLTESCMTLGPTGARLLTSGVGISGAVHPAAADGKVGRLQAIDIANWKVGWQQDLEWPPSTGVLATGGGLVFVGDLQPSLKAFDHETGKPVWEVPLDEHPSSGVITYEVDGTQYIAVIVGMKNFHIGALSGALLQRDIEAAEQARPAPTGAAGIWVFSL